MDQVSGFFDWLFGTRPGVAALFIGGILLFLVIAIVLERKTHEVYFNHEKGEDEEDGIFDSLEDDDEEDPDKG